MKSSRSLVFAFACLAVFALLAACGSSSDEPVVTDGDTEAEQVADGDAESETLDLDQDFPEGTFSDPWTVMPAAEMPSIRGQKIFRGVLHNHSPYSHDACDGKPRVEADGDVEWDVWDTDVQEGMMRNEQCFEDLRDSLCKTKMDFIFMSDHPTLYAEYEYPEVLMYKEGDTLIMRNGKPVANWIKCPDGRQVMLAAGTEGTMMELGMEEHVAPTIAERQAILSPDKSNTDALNATIEKVKAVNGMPWLMHTEEWTPAELKPLNLVGFESYNVHANLMMDKSTSLKLIAKLATHPEELPVGELLLIAIFAENQLDLLNWSSVSQVKHIATSFGTDAHRNVAPGLLDDGDRLDSFRRLMHWFSNYVLVPEGQVATLDDRIYKDLIQKGHMFNVFDYLGYPIGFDFHGEVGTTIYEMGDVAPKDATVTLKVALPSVYKLDPRVEAPLIRGRIFKATGETWVEVPTTLDEKGLLSANVQNGVYRAQIDITPKHLAKYMQKSGKTYLGEKPWIYSNAIWVGEPSAAGK